MILKKKKRGDTDPSIVNPFDALKELRNLPSDILGFIKDGFKEPLSFVILPLVILGVPLAYYFVTALLFDYAPRRLLYGKPGEAWLDYSLVILFVSIGLIIVGRRNQKRRAKKAKETHLHSLQKELDALLEQLKEIIKQKGRLHPEVAFLMRKISKNQIQQGSYTEAESTCREELEILQKCLGSSHPEVAITLRSLSKTIIQYDRGPERESLEKMAKEIEVVR
jgi:hypothetical protein